ncbi:hypothetical protein EC988_007847, partial [Linderina pennispora]
LIRPPRSSLPVGTRWSQGSVGSPRFSLPASRSSIGESLGGLGSRASSVRSLDPFASDGSGLVSPADSASRIPSPASGLRAPTPLLAALNRQQHRLESTRADMQVPALRLAGSSASLPLGPVSTPISGLRAPGSLASGMRVPRTLISGIRPPSDLRLRPAKSNASLHKMFTEESRRTRKPDVRTLFKPDVEFLTLRPVHTPDLVLRKFDPRMVERAMTPMLKTSVRLSATRRGKIPEFSDSDSEVAPLDEPGDEPGDETLGMSASMEELMEAYCDDCIDSVPSMAYLPDETKMESRLSDLGSPELVPEAPRRFPTPKFLRRKQSQPSLIKPPSTSGVARLSSSLLPTSLIPRASASKPQP